MDVKYQVRLTVGRMTHQGPEGEVIFWYAKIGNFVASGQSPKQALVRLFNDIRQADLPLPAGS